MTGAEVQYPLNLTLVGRRKAVGDTGTAERPVARYCFGPGQENIARVRRSASADGTRTHRPAAPA
jgi:hypothetical protein